MITVLAVLLAACGDDGGGGEATEEDDGTASPPPASTSEPPPLAPPVTSTIDLAWKSYPAFGGPVTDILPVDDRFYVAKGEAIWSYGRTSGEWKQSKAHGERLFILSNGDIFTDYGYRLNAGEDEWVEMFREGRLEVGYETETLYRFFGQKIETSYDSGRTWKTLTVAPRTPLWDLAEFNGDLYAIIVIGFQPWKYDPETDSWQELSDSLEAPYNFVNADDSLYAMVHSGLLSTEDGAEWHTVTLNGESIFPSEEIGKDPVLGPLFGIASSIYTVQDHKLVRQSSHPSIFRLYAYERLDSTTHLVGGVTGLWRVSNEDEVTSEDQIGVPGSHATSLFHLSTSTFARVGPSAGWGYLARLDKSSGRWQREMFSASNPSEIVPLQDGSLLIGVSDAYEGVHGAILHWNVQRDEVKELYRGRGIAALAVDRNERFFAVTTDSLDGRGRQLLISRDSGETWSSDDTTATSVASVCGSVETIGTEGVSAYDPANGWSATKDFPETLEFDGVATRADRILVYSRNRMWRRTRCDGEFEEVPLPPETTIWDATLDDDGRIWAVNESGHGIVLNPGADEWRRFGQELGDLVLYSVWVDLNGTIWVRQSETGIWASETF